MPNLIHLLFCMVLGIIILSVIMVNLLRSVFGQSGETAPDNRKTKQENRKAQEKQKFSDNLNNKEYSQFEKELDGIYNDLEGISEHEPVVFEDSNYRDIYHAYDAGVNITDLARKFKKNQGEIELILNLRSRGDGEVAADE
ncbi:MAG: hypothetical protein AAGU27_07215 [Dehalobacterium sp.]